MSHYETNCHIMKEKTVGFPQSNLITVNNAVLKFILADHKNKALESTIKVYDVCKK